MKSRGAAARPAQLAPVAFSLVGALLGSKRSLRYEKHRCFVYRGGFVFKDLFNSSLLYILLLKLKSVTLWTYHHVRRWPRGRCSRVIVGIYTYHHHLLLVSIFIFLIIKIFTISFSLISIQIDSNYEFLTLFIATVQTLVFKIIQA